MPVAVSVRRCPIQPALLLLAVLHAPSALAASPTVTVLYFDNDTGDASFDPLGKGLADMMTTDLAQAPGVQVVEREKLEALLKELKLQRTRYVDPATVQKIGKGLGAEFAVAGSFVSAAPDLRIDVRVVRIDSGKIVKAHKVIGRKEKFFDLQQQLAAALLDGLLPALSVAERGRVKEAQAKNRVDDVATALDYGKGLDLRDRGELGAASQQLQKVMTGAPGFALAKSRYLQVMKQLYLAKDARAAVLKRTDEELLSHLESTIAVRMKKLDLNWRMILPAMVLRGQIHLKRLADSLDRPAAEYRPHLEAYLKTEEEIVELVVDLNGKRPLNSGYGLCGDEDWRPMCLRREELERAADLGLPDPMRNSHFVDLHQILQDHAGLLIAGTRPYYTPIKFPKRICFYKLDKSFAERSLKLLDRSQALLDRYSRDQFQQRWIDEEMESQIYQQAMTLLRLGRQEDALAKLQAILTRFPKSAQFASTEAAIRTILTGEMKGPKGEPLLPPCEDPK